MKKGTILPLILFFASATFIISLLVILDNRSKAKNQDPNQASSSSSLTGEVGYNEATESVIIEATRSVDADEGSTDWKTYRSSTANYEIKYPPESNIEYRQDNPDQNTAELIVVSSNKRWAVTISVLNNPKYLTPFDWYKKTLQIEPVGIPNKQNSTFAGLPAYKDEFTNESESGIIFYVPKGNKIYQIQFGDDLGFPNKKAFDQITSTFKFTQ